MNIQQQKEVLTLYQRYQATSKDTIKANLKAHMDRAELKPATVTEQTGIPVATIYQLRKHNNNYKPDFITALTLCNLLEISIIAVMEQVTGLTIPEPKTKWNITAKQGFIADYKTLEVTELCKKYNITPRTAQEYNRVFSDDLGI